MSTPYRWSCDLSPDGKWYVTVGYRDEARIFSTEPFQEIALLPKSSDMLQMAFTPDGQYVLGWESYPNYKLHCWRADTWEKVDPPFRSPNQAASGLETIQHTRFELCPDGKWLATLNYFTLRVLNLQSDEVSEITLPPETNVAAIAFRPGADQLVSWSVSKLNVIDLNTKQVIHTCQVPTHNRLYQGKFTADGKYLLIVGNDKLVHVIDAENWKPLHQLQWPLGKLRCIVISPDGLTAATGGATAKIIVWDLDL